MSASAKVGMDAEAEMAALPAGSPRGGTAEYASGEAFQALLAFSALHQQIRQRRTGNTAEPAELPADKWQLEHFVLDEVLQLVAQRALAVTGADGVAIALAEGEAIVCRASAGKITPDAGARLDPGAGFSGACLRSGQIIRCDDSESDARVDAAACRALGARSMVAVPLSAKQTIIGLVEAFSSEAFGFNDSDVRGLSLLAELILAALRPEEEDRLAEISQKTLKNVEDGQKERMAEPAAAAAPAPMPEPAETAAERVVESGGTHRDFEIRIAADEAAEMVVAEAEPAGAPPGLAIVVLLIAVATLIGSGLWWGIHQRSGAATLPEKAQAPVAAVAPGEKAAGTSEAAAQTAPADAETDQAETTSTGHTEKPEVTAIRHWSSADSSTVVIDLEDQVQYEAHRLSHPERIYVDLSETRLAASLFNKTIEVDDALLGRIRVAQPTPGVTRVVLETKGASNFSVSLEQNPYRLVIELRTIGSDAKPRAKVELFPPDGRAATLFAENATPGLKASAGGPKLRVVLDAGHGGWDLGTVGKKGLLEKDLVLDITERLGKLVQTRLGAAVIYTRTADDYIPLEKRAEIANLAKANLFVSIHANYSDYASARGVETYYTNTYSSVRARMHDEGDDEAGEAAQVDWTNVDIRQKVLESRRLAASVQRALYSTLASKNPGLPNRGVKQAQYVVLTGTAMPAVLAEVSFVSSPTDENNLQSSSYRQRIAEALYEGVARYAEESRVKVASAQMPAGR